MTTLASTGDDILAEIRSVWTTGADDYDADPGHGLITPIVEDAWVRLLGSMLGSTPKTVLDVGAGTGFLSVLAARAGHRVTALDLTPAMLDRAKDRARNAGVSITFVEGDAAATSFDANQFDAVISRHLLWTLTDPAAAFREWIRVVRIGGEVIWFDSLQRRPRIVGRAKALASNTVARIGQQDTHGNGHHYDDELIEHLPFRGLQSTAPIRELLEGIGVRDVSCRATPGVERAERQSMPLQARLGEGSMRYAGRFPVTADLKMKLGSNG